MQDLAKRAQSHPARPDSGDFMSEPAAPRRPGPVRATDGCATSDLIQHARGHVHASGSPLAVCLSGFLELILRSEDDLSDMSVVAGHQARCYSPILPGGG